ncbi:MAG: SseB family protein, partial [Lachnospiraceae bacterium]|nr:SseB family protein [Lachnospiraceae bacterium]
PLSTPFMARAAYYVNRDRIYDISGRSQVAKYAVLTSVKPQSNRKDPSSIENPYVWGLSFGFKKFIKEADYFDILVSELLMTNILVPMYREEEGYAALSRTDPSGKVELLVFTDKYQMLLGDWKKAKEREDDLRITAMRFTDCIDMICSQNKKTAGIAINAYGKFPLVLSEEMLNMLYQSGEFQRIIQEQSQL